MTISIELIQIGFGKTKPILIEGRVSKQSFRRKELEIINRIGFNQKEPNKITGYNDVKFTIRFPEKELENIKAELKERATMLNNFAVTYDGLTVNNCYIEHEYLVDGDYCLDVYSKQSSHY
jgi:hypothetical protein